MKNITDKYVSYEDLIDSFEVETLLMEAVGDYQGDYYTLLKDGERYGFLVFGYGSCSGCDPLEGEYGNLEGLNSLRDELWDSIRWNTREKMIEYITNKDEKLEWWGHRSGYKDFKASALNLLSS